MLQNCLRRTFFAAALLTAIFLQSATAQQATPTPGGLKGLVLDNYARPLRGVVVTVKGSGEKISTDDEGSFVLNAAMPATLVIQHPLFNTQEVSARNNMIVRLDERYLRSLHGADTSVIENKPMRKTELLYESKSYDKIISSVGTVYGPELRTTPSSLYLNALQGRLAGLAINQTSGFYKAVTSSLIDVDIFVGNIPKNTSGTGPTDNTEFDVLLRGHQGRGQSPVTIIDGVQRDIYSIDPQNIESISILRDAMSSVLLGQNSSRGVLLVTTRNPLIGAPHISFTAETGTQSSLGLPTPLSAYQYAYLTNEALLNEGRAAAYTSADFNAYRTGSDPYGHPDVNWYNTIIKSNPLITRYNLSLDGGGTRARYIVSLSYLNQDGFFVTDPNTSYNTNLQLKRYLLNSKIDVDVNSQFNIGLQLFGRLQQGNQPGAGASAILSSLLTTPNNAYPVRNPNGSYGGNSNYRTNLLSMTQSTGYLNDNSNDVMANLDLTYRFDKWVPGLYFKARGNVSVQSSSLIDRSKNQAVYLPVVNNPGDTTYNNFGDVKNQVNNFTSTSWARYTFAQLSLGYDKKIGEHNFQFLGLFDKKTTLLNYDIPSRLTNIAVKVSYDYKGKYLAEAAVNYSGYNRYAPGDQYGVFYAAGLGWNIAKEDFIKDNISWINEMKLRATFGQTGNANVDNFGYYIYRSFYTDVAGTYPIGNTYQNNAGLSEGGAPNSAPLANINATWEKAHKLDVGLDLSMFNNHFQLTGDFYYERYYDLMQQRGKSIQLIGRNYPFENIGINNYSGVELTATYQNRIGSLNYFITANASLQDSKVIFMDEQFQPNEWNKQTGKMAGQWFGLISDGFIQTYQEAQTVPTVAGYTPKVGDFKYKDLNGDGVIDRFDVAPIGKQKPLIYYGLTVGFNYKGFAVSALVQGVTNRDIYSGNGYTDAGFQSQNNGFSQAYVQSLGRWIPENAANAIYPRLTPGGNNYNTGGIIFTSNSAFMHDGNYLRLKNVNVEYTIPYSWIKRYKLAGVKLFFNAQNLATWAAYDMRDPEVVLPNYPLQKVLNFGINVKL
ncbi:MAG: SusC/RagA family TonB-linked outer membrane protein [Citrobacter freundii]|nr:MAG: SusC/RagA family TonB-linked outer membrane protein [Citrobacter freundii]